MSEGAHGRGSLMPRTEATPGGNQSGEERWIEYASQQGASRATRRERKRERWRGKKKARRRRRKNRLGEAGPMGGKEKQGGGMPMERDPVPHVICSTGGHGLEAARKRADERQG